MIKIYMHRNKVNGKSYIGQTERSIEERRCKNWYGYKRCTALYAAINKHGCENFETNILELCETFDDANIREQHWIGVYDTVSPNGYNLTSGGSNGKPSGETRHKMSEAKKGKKLSNEHRHKISEAHKGKKFSDEARQNMSESAKVRKISDETRKKMSEARKGENHPLYGKKHSDETRKKMSEAQKHPIWAFSKYIIRLYKKGWSYDKLSRYYGCSLNTIRRIINDYESKQQPQQLSLF